MSSLTAKLANHTYTSSSVHQATHSASPLLQIPQEIIDEILGHVFGNTYFAIHTKPGKANTRKTNGLSILRTCSLLSGSAIKNLYSSSNFRYYLISNDRTPIRLPARELVDLIRNVEFDISPLSYEVYEAGFREDAIQSVFYANLMDPTWEALIEMFAGTGIPRIECRAKLSWIGKSAPRKQIYRTSLFEAIKKLSGFQTLTIEIQCHRWGERAHRVHFPDPDDDRASICVSQCESEVEGCRAELEPVLGPSKTGVRHEFSGRISVGCYGYLEFHPREYTAELLAGGESKESCEILKHQED